MLEEFERNDGKNRGTRIFPRDIREFSSSREEWHLSFDLIFLFFFFSSPSFFRVYGREARF